MGDVVLAGVASVFDSLVRKGDLAARFGDYVLLRPPLRATTFLLWSAPVVLILLCLWCGVRYLRGVTRRQRESTFVAPELRKPSDGAPP